MPFLCSRCAKEGLVYIMLASPSTQQPFSYSECTKANIQLFYNICSASNTKYTRPITLNSLQVP